MADQAQFQNQQGLLPIEKLIRPAHVPNLSYLSQEQKLKYQQGIAKLWTQINSNSDPNNPERQQAHRKLSELSNSLKNNMIRWQATQTRNAQQAQRQPQQQNAQPSQPAAGPGPQQSGQHPPTQQPPYSDRVKDLARSLNVVVPSHIRGKTQEEQVQFVNGEKRRYAAALHRYETCQKQLDSFQHNVQERNKQTPFSAEDREKIQKQVQQLQRQAQEARNMSLSIKQQASDPNSHAQQTQQQQTQPQQPQSQQVPPQPPQQPPQQSAPPSSQRPAQQPQQQPQSVAPQIKQEAPQQQQVKKEPADPIIKPEPTTGQDRPSSIPSTQPQTSVSQPAASQSQTQAVPPAQTTSNSQAAVKVPTPTSTTQPSTQGAPSSGATSQTVHPLSHQAALERAAQNYNPATQQPTHGHPAQGSQPQSIQRESGATTQAATQVAAPATRPTQRPLNIPPPQPITMAAARPSLSGGPGAVGAMGQPAIQKPPGFSLEGDTDRVLSKKKLDDLVRQVTGGSGVDGTESLDPDVEETLLDVADEFVDNVIMQACRLAKLRSSATLELRDLQLVLERNYNIRVPGFAADELRTIKKIQPTQAWTQKMSAVQAAKVTGGKADL